MRSRLTIEQRILAAVAGSVLGVWSWHVYVDYRVQRAQQEAWAGVLRAAANPDPMGIRAAMRAQQSYQLRYDLERQRAVIDERSRYILGSNQRCYGGVVVQIDGATYTQLGSIAKPVRCSGQVADQPLR